jgi:glycine cleavage system regulatory protein
VDTNADLVLTIIGADRPGLVELLARTVADHGGNWEASRMARMAGRFAGILRVSIPAGSADPLVEGLRALEGQGLRVVVEPSAPAAPAEGHRRLRLELIGNDRAGVIRDVSTALAEREVNVEELSTECASAPMSGGMLLKVTAELCCPPSVPVDELRGELEQLVSDFIVDLGELDQDGRRSPG